MLYNVVNETAVPRSTLTAGLMGLLVAVLGFSVGCGIDTTADPVAPELTLSEFSPTTAFLGEVTNFSIALSWYDADGDVIQYGVRVLDPAGTVIDEQLSDFGADSAGVVQGTARVQLRISTGIEGDWQLEVWLVDRELLMSEAVAATFTTVPR